MQEDTGADRLPVIRALMLRPWVGSVGRMGAPAEALLERAGIRPELLERPDAAVPLERALRWIELVCRSLGTEHVGVDVGRETSIERLGGYGRTLAQARTLRQYLDQGVALYRTVVQGQAFRLSTRGSRVRLEVGAPWEPRLGDHQAHLQSLAVTVASIRRFAGPRWAPTKIGLGFRAREVLPASEVFGDARVLHTPGPSYLEFPRSLLDLQLPPAERPRPGPAAATPRPLPRDLAGLVELQLESWLPEGVAPVAQIAETLGMSTRSLQRGLAVEGKSYTELLDAVRLRRAAEWLERTDRPVVEIAFDLGYTDASNFTRAFRRQTGVSPQAFRRGARRPRRRS
jgi:AraC-like DNA-binding protein